MSHFVALNPHQHKNLKVLPDKVAQTGRNSHTVSVVLSEFTDLIVQYPIVFTKDADSGQFVCSALLGFEKGENLFWQNDRWEGLYIPAQVQRRPFYIGQQENEDGENHLVCIDTESDAVSEDSGEPLFDENGQPTPLMTDKQELLALLLEGKQHTKAFIKALVELELLTPISLDISFIDGSSKKVEGIYTIDEDRLAGLYGETVGILHERGFLAPAYTMLASHAHIYSLIERKNSRLSARK
ncbi:SapC family protein [Salinimonas chungwhensis]|uniref:SapC family protein n=1 Tax=Salinimonas chungwhensis TaxID=265425 RepID=UPI00035DD62A|nr:SapC family protein [Salinimonas chungwhensis]